jgi:hypothetical protein
VNDFSHGKLSFPWMPVSQIVTIKRYHIGVNLFEMPSKNRSAGGILVNPLAGRLPLWLR